MSSAAMHCCRERTVRPRTHAYQGTLQKQGWEQFFQTIPHSSAAATLSHLHQIHLNCTPVTVKNSILASLAQTAASSWVRITITSCQAARSLHSPGSHDM